MMMYSGVYVYEEPSANPSLSSSIVAGRTAQPAGVLINAAHLHLSIAFLLLFFNIMLMFFFLPYSDIDDTRVTFVGDCGIPRGGYGLYTPRPPL